MVCEARRRGDRGQAVDRDARPAPKYARAASLSSNICLTDRWEAAATARGLASPAGYRALLSDDFQRRENLGNSDWKSVMVLSKITAWALTDREAETSFSGSTQSPLRVIAVDLEVHFEMIEGDSGELSSHEASTERCAR
jgi:hypothetical protein